jgi:hypothetical protein
MNYGPYFRRLLERESLAVAVPFRAVTREVWTPKKNECHKNVDYWVEHYPGVKAVRGWLFWGPNEAQQFNLMAHSVIEEGGTLVDITPIDQNTPREGLRFLPHLGTEEEFIAMKTSCSQVLYPPISFEEWRESQLAMHNEEVEF